MKLRIMASTTFAFGAVLAVAPAAHASSVADSAITSTAQRCRHRLPGAVCVRNVGLGDLDLDESRLRRMVRSS